MIASEKTALIGIRLLILGSILFWVSFQYSASLYSLAENKDPRQNTKGDDRTTHIGLKKNLALVKNKVRRQDTKADDRKYIGLKKNLGSCRFFTPRSGKDKVEMHNFVNRLNFAHVQHFVAFLSIERAGHSWIGSVLDAAPNALVANEYGIFETFKKKRRNMTRNTLFEGIAKNSFLCGKYGRIHVYNYSIPGLWQGKIGDGHTIQVIGDKRGGTLTNTLMSFGKP